jgi:hypothetical protein
MERAYVPGSRIEFPKNMFVLVLWMMIFCLYTYSNFKKFDFDKK